MNSNSYTPITRRTTSASLNPSVKRSAASTSDAAYKYQRTSITKEQSIYQNQTEDDLIGPQRIIHNLDGDEEVSTIPQQSKDFQNNIASADNVQSGKQLLNSLLRCDPNSEALIQFNEGPREIPKKPIVDSRTKDNDTQRYYFRAINDYLTKTGYSYDLPVSYRQIASMQFEQAFKYLIDRIIPGHVFERKLDVNVKYLAEALGYPYADQVAKSISSLGALHTGGTMYAFLHFLVNFAKAMDLPLIKENDDINSLQIDREGLTGLLHNYAVSRLHEDDPLVVEQKLQETFENVNKRNQRYIEESRASINRLLQEMKQFETITERLSQSMSRNQELNSDKAKFTAYIEEKKRKITKYGDLNERVRGQLALLNQQMESIAYEKSVNRSKLAEKNLTVEEVKELIEKRKSLEEEYNQRANVVDKMRQQFNEKVTRMNELKEKIKNAVENYNTKLRGLAYITNHRQLTIDFEELMNNISPNILKDITVQIDQLHEECTTEYTKIKKETLDLRNQTDLTQKTGEEIKSEAERFEKQADMEQKYFEETHNKFIRESERYNSMKMSHRKEAENRLNQAQIELFESKKDLLADKEKLNEMKASTEEENKQLFTAIKELLDEIRSVKEFSSQLSAGIDESTNIVKNLSKHFDV